MEIEWRDPKDLTPHPENYRDHPPEQVADICESIRTNGQYKNIVVNKEDLILCGHGVTLACIEMGQPEVAVVVFDGTEAEQRRLMVADNELSRMAEDDDRALSEQLKELQQDFGDLRGTGWDEKQLANFIYVTRPEDEIEDFDAAAEWVGMPDMGEEERETRVKTIVWTDTTEEREDLLDLLGAKPAGKNRTTVSVQWPADKERETRRDASLLFEDEEK